MHIKVLRLSNSLAFGTICRLYDNEKDFRCFTNITTAPVGVWYLVF